MDLMLDIETLDTTPQAVAIQIGVAIFDPKTGDIESTAAFYVPLDEQQRAGRTISVDTLEWWLDSDRAATFQRLMTVSRDKGLSRLQGFLEWLVLDPKNTPERVWTNGNFDEPILRSLVRTMLPGTKIPWGFWNVYDLRTLKRVAALPKNFAGPTPHDAVEDCVKQVAELMQCFALLGVAQ